MRVSSRSAVIVSSAIAGLCVISSLAVATYTIINTPDVYGIRGYSEGFLADRQAEEHGDSTLLPFMRATSKVPIMKMREALYEPNAER